MHEAQARFDLSPQEIATATERLGPLFRPRYNIAPSQPVLTIVADGAEVMRWGLIPGWAKDPSIGDRMINARAETVAEKPSFRHALRRKRCVVLADGFYEWRKDATGRKLPFCIALEDEAPFAFAGLWDAWRDLEGQVIRSCTIITTTPNALMASIHDRMPVILLPEAEALWLDQRVDDPARVLPLLAPYPAEHMRAWEVSS
ncbi:MAG: SOS response-associated peptidase, partial [Chloroflexi bacterium]|nr:SOS response-associated peptidase [Chloroflexota bacterium]